MVMCQGQLEQLGSQFDKMDKKRVEYLKVGIVCLALVATDMDDGSSEDVFLRARIKEINDNQASTRSLLPACHLESLTDDLGH